MPGIAVRQFPVLQLLPYQVLAQSKELVAQRLQVLEGLARGERLIVVAPVEAILRRLAPPELFCAEAVNLAVGDRVDLDKLLNLLPDLGYERVDLVEGRGQYALRGGILDVFPMTAHRPSRLEFFDDEVDSIRRFNISTQRTEERQPPGHLSRQGTGGQPGRPGGCLDAFEKEYWEQERKLTRSGDAELSGSLEKVRESAGERGR